jgi:uncharacterized membrane protein
MYGTEVKIVNNKLRDLSLAILYKQPGTYLTWLYFSFRSGLTQMTQLEPIVIYFSKFIFIAIITILAFYFAIYFKIYRYIDKLKQSSTKTLLAIVLVAAAVTLIRVLLLPLSNTIQSIIVVSPDEITSYFARHFLGILFFISTVSIVNNLLSRRNTMVKFLSVPLSYKLSAMVFIGMTFYLSGLVLVILVEPPIARYMLAVLVFIPSIFSLSILMLVSSAYHKLRTMWLLNHNQ